jgi:hypothetical protein
LLLSFCLRSIVPSPCFSYVDVIVEVVLIPFYRVFENVICLSCLISDVSIHAYTGKCDVRNGEGTYTSKFHCIDGVGACDSVRVPLLGQLTERSSDLVVIREIVNANIMIVVTSLGLWYGVVIDHC